MVPYFLLCDFGNIYLILTLRHVYGVGSPTVDKTSSVHLHICSVTYMTKISLHVTKHQYTQTQAQKSLSSLVFTFNAEQAWLSFYVYIDFGN